VQVDDLRLVASGQNVNNKGTKKNTRKRKVLGGTGVLVTWRKGYLRADGQTVAEKTVGAVDNIGASLNSLYANTYGKLNLDA